MANLFYHHVLVVLLFASARIEAQEIKSARLLDLLIRNYTFKSYDIHIRTGKIHAVRLPANFSGIVVDTASFRCGSLRRYGAQVKEFHLGVGVIVQPCVQRVVVIRQKLGYNWSSIYYDNYDLPGYQLVSPILGLLAYHVGNGMNFSDSLELRIHAGEAPISIDFRNTSTSNISSGNDRILCANFENDGKVTLKDLESPNICVTTRHGHYGLVIKTPPPLESTRKDISTWKLVVGTSIGTVLGVSLLGLLLVAMFVKVKKKARMEEMERRAYEEEALQVSMVGHIRAPSASATRTMPTIEHT
ncbi:hypothetical protein K2173_018232 [Erythroxylum novogranatense]|uniref:Uncharacterized protein n=1 Tax=Erythroxylum novogranatense TaxID=1862640 RepID=A0AAV8TNL9_9ROSI|nr:hypothetical protein K2173_018232 [Erythroxylum novogranatense]